jgi:hypothetical protein
MKQNFTKADLKDGMVVQYRNGWYRIVLGGCTTLGMVCSDVYETRSKDLSDYNDDLTNRYDYRGLDIMKVFNVEQVLWERKEIKLSDAERAWLTVAKHDGRQYIARDSNGKLYAYTERPIRGFSSWHPTGDNTYKKIWSENLFEFITFYDNEPYLIEDLLKL